MGNVLKRYNGTNWEAVGGTVTGDTLPIGSEVDFDGTSANIPVGWEEVTPQAQILWTNPNPTSSMSSGTTITLSSDDYDILEIFYDIAAGAGSITSARIIKGKDARLTFSAIGVSAYAYNSMRQLVYVSDTSYTVQDGYFQRTNASTASTDNSRLIPIYIIGYKTGLFS